jgi:hypothetical protein
MFLNKNPYDLKLWDKMRPACECCGQTFEPETGFYYGSMYVSYGLTILISILVFIPTFFLMDMDILTYILVNSIILIVLMPYTFRVSRVLWLNSFVHYDPNVKINENCGNK